FSLPLVARTFYLGPIGENIITVGSLSDEFDSVYSRAKPDQPKYESALYKVLAAIGVVVQKHQLYSRAKIKIHLAVLLPCNEYSDRHRFEKALSAICSSYKFREQTLKVKIDKFFCRPEGGGLAMARMALNSPEWFVRQRLGVVMLGSRNLTALYFKHGELKVSESPLMGFSYLVNDIVKQTSGLTPEKITEAIFSGLRQVRYEYSDRNGCKNQPVWAELEPIQDLATAFSSGLRSQEITHIANVIETVALDWSEKMDRWLGEVFPSNLTEISISGGSIPFFAPIIEQHFNCPIYSTEPKAIDSDHSFVPIYLGAGIVRQVERTLQLRTRDAVERALSYRLIDCYAVLDHLIAMNLEEKKLEQTKTA
ncbi:MAG: hypothetical protein SWZ49_29050, partial [Cyanobacteriota bacterium]|nr:hypothetical protein [Cyanobacteriota bacterium]